MEKEIGEIDFAKSGSIVPVIVQDADTLKVLTLAYANKEALDLAKKTGNSWFWSRSVDEGRGISLYTLRR